MKGVQAGPTFIGYFDTAQAARQCLLDLHLAGFGAGQVGLAMPRRRTSLASSTDTLTTSRQPAGGETGATIVTVRAGERRSEAARIVRRGGGDEAAARPGSALRHTVNRAIG